MPFYRLGGIGSGGGVTNGDAHDHFGGDGAQIDHVNLANKGTNTHAQIDTHIGTGSHVTNGDAHDHFGGDGAQIDHANLANKGTHTHAQIDAVLGYPVEFGATSGGTVADATLYYFSQTRFTGATDGKKFLPKAGTIKAIYGSFGQGAGSGEASTLNIRLNNATDTLISNTLVHNAAATDFSKTDLNIAVAAGDYIVLKWLTPTWATNPTAVTFSATIWVET